MSMEAGASAIVLGTRRLDLRPLVMEDLGDLTRLFADEKTMRNQCRRGTRDDAQSYIRHHLKFYDLNGFGQLAVIERETGTFVGKCGFSAHEIDDFREFILNYLIDPVYEQNGHDYDFESFAAMCEHAFNELDFMRVVTMIKPRNKRIIRVATENGFDKEKEVTWEGLKMHLYARQNE